jgi:hypothetical protein
MSAVAVVAAVLVLANLALTIALAQRVRQLQLVVAQGGMRDPALPRPGDRVGAFTLTTLAGARLTEATLGEGESLVGFFRAGCPTCSQLRTQLLAQPLAVPMLAVVVFFGHDERDRAAASIVADSLRPIAEVAVTRDDDGVVRAFRESGYPTLIRVARGHVVAAGHRLVDVLS